jgi:hypothetical protein
VAVVFLLVRFCRRRYYSRIDRQQKLFAGDLERSVADPHFLTQRWVDVADGATIRHACSRIGGMAGRHL